MRSEVIASLMSLMVGACATTSVDSPTLEEWCSDQAADRCVEAVVMLHDAPEQEACIVASRPDLPLFDQCGVVPNPNPVTTIPPPGVDPAQAALHRFIEEELPLLDSRIVAVLTAADPPTPVTVGIVFDHPIAVRELEDFTQELGGTWVSAWRSDFICIPGVEGQPAALERFAYRDGVERAAAARRAADESEAALTGRFIVEAMWDRMEQAALAVREPGVLLEATQVAIPVSSLPALADHPLVSRVRLAVTPDVAGDLSEPPPLECINPAG